MQSDVMMAGVTTKNCRPLQSAPHELETGRFTQVAQAPPPLQNIPNTYLGKYIKLNVAAG